MNLRKLLTTAALFVVGALGFNANAQASYNFTYDEGVAVTEGTDYFLYNVGAKKFLTDGMDWGTHATVDNAGRVITFASLAEGKYSIHTKSYSVNNGAEEKAGYMTLNGYLDTGKNDANWEFTPVTADGYTNVYTIKHSDTQYLIYNQADSRVNVGENTGDNNSYWIIIPKDVRDTKGDYSYYLQNTDFNRPWERVIWNGFTSDWWNNQSGGNENNRCAEFYNHAFELSQSVSSSLPKGKYTVNCQGFYRTESGDDIPAVLYANNSSSSLNKIVHGEENNMSQASESFNAGRHVVSVSTILTDGKLKTGIKNTTTNWVIFDNFTLHYDGPVIATEATSLPTDGNIEAGKWYYIDIPADAEYNVTATTADDIVYTTDGTILIADEDDVTENFPSGNVNLVQGRYYVKSTSNNNISIVASTHTYTLGDATTSIIDGAYIQNLNTFVVTYANATTTDADAELAVIGSTKAILSKGEAIVAEGTLIADNAAKTLTATFTDVTLDLSSAYTISIAAGVFGYNGKATNEAISININTPVVADGYCYMYNTETKSYLSRSGIYATSAVLDEWGIAVYLTTDNEGKTTIQYFDSKRYVGGDGWCWGDFESPTKFNVTKVDNGYKFINTNNSKYFAAYERNGIYQSVGDAVEGDNLYGTSNVWVLETLTDHHANNYTKNADAQALKAVTEAKAAGVEGLNGIETATELESYLEGLSKEYITITGADTEKYQVYAAAEETLKEAEYYKDIVNGLKPGLYKLSVDAFQRAATNEDVANAEGARGLIYVYAGNAKTQLKSAMEYGHNEAYSNDWGNYEYNGKHYPNNHDVGRKALDTGNYKNNVYVYVADGGDGTGSLTFGINNPTRLGNSLNRHTWAVYKNFTLTYYGSAKATATEIEALEEAIETAEAKTLGFDKEEYAPYNNVDAIKALTEAKAIDTATASSESVVNATTALVNAIWTANATEVNAVYNGDFALCENNGAMAGWTMSNNTLGGSYHSRAFVGDERLAEFNTTNSGAYLRFDGTNSNRGSMYYYGRTEGYTMPLKANTTYYVSVDVKGWGSTGKPIRLNVTGPEGFTALGQSFNTTHNADKDDEAPQKFYIVFTTGEVAGDYVINFQVPGSDSNTHSVMVSNVKLFSLEALALSDTEVFAGVYAETKYPKVNLTRTFKAGYNTMALPFNTTAEALGGKVYEFTGEGIDMATGETVLTMSEVTDVVANIPYFFYTENKIENPSYENVEVVAMASETVKPSDCEWSFISNYTPNFSITGNYGVQEDKVKKGGSTAYVNGMRAYFTYSGTSEAGARISFGGEATGINAIEVLQNGDAEIYTINGTRVNALQKGINIVKMSNGKTQKVLVK